MKKIFAILMMVLLMAAPAWAVSLTGGGGGGGGSVDTTGTPAQYQWAEWSDADTLKGTAVTGSKVVCTDANGSPTACTNLTDTAFSGYQASDADLTTIAGLTVAQGKFIIGSSSPAWSASAYTLPTAVCTSGYLLKSDGTNMVCSNSLSVTIDDSAAQFVGVTTDHTGKAKIDLTTSTPTKTTTLKLANADDATITFPSVTSTLVAETVATGGVILGDTSPDAAGELGYASTQLIFHDGTAARNVAKAGTLTNTKWCTTDGTVINCAEDAPAGAGDITAVGSCTSGSCATIGNADTSGGYIDFLEDSDNGTNYVRLKAPDSTADATVTLPNTTGTLAILGANTFTADQTITGNILPEAANTRTIGSATAEWADLYLGDGAVINLGNDQDVTITHVADSGLTLAANSEDLTLAATANTWTVSSSTGVTDIKFQGAAAANAMNLATTGTILGAVKVLNAGATEGSGAHTYSPGAADIYGSMILITDSDSVTTVNLPDYQASADADHVKIGASVCVYNTVAKATIVDVAADDTITTTNGTTNAAGASVTGPATIGAFSCFMLVSASSDVGNWAQLGLNGAWPVTP